jgi:Ser/Thr protein kinase RdoA (MazF antagonist)
MLDPGSLLALGADLAGVIPGVERPIRTLADSLARRVTHSGTEGSATVHGDFHVDQVLLAGDRVVLVDLDRAGRGDRHADLGAFLAHTEESDLPLECRDAFLRGYTEAGGVAPDPGALAAARAAALFRRSIFPFRTLLPDWPMEIRRRLYRIDQLLHGGNS